MMVVDATREHGEDFMSRPVRQADIDEWVLGGGQPWVTALMQALKGGSEYRRALLNEGGGCIALWGGQPDPKLGAIVWLIASEEAEERASFIHRRMWDDERDLMHNTLGPELHAFSWAHNPLHHRWMGRVGFEIVGQVTIGASWFFHFSRRAQPSAPPSPSA